MGADAVGFIFAPSTRQVAAQMAYDITRRLPPEILTVGVFRDEHPTASIDIAHRPASRRCSCTVARPPAQTTEIAGQLPVGDQGVRLPTTRTCPEPISTAPT